MRTAPELLAKHEARLETIRQLVGVPSVHWEMLYLVMLRAFAAFVQELPASEAHHHAGPGGLLAHALEVTQGALELRRGHMLPAGVPVETVASEQDLWTYAVATGALLHDFGKPVADLRIALLDRAGKPLGFWVPTLGPMPGAAAWYRVTFVRERRYRLHEKLPPLLAHHIVPAPGLSWLGSHLGVLEAWLACLSGDAEAAGPLAAIVGQADRRSVAVDLTGDPGRLPDARARPLHERLLTALRHLLAAGELPLNRRGAAGWLTEMDLWLVSKRALDALRAHLKQEGAGGVPSRNERLMDELQQRGVVAPNGDQAIWTVEVTVDDWRQQLTTLRFPVRRVWPDPDACPERFAGAVTPVEELAPPATAPPTVALSGETGSVESASGNERTPGTVVPAGRPLPAPLSASPDDAPGEEPRELAPATEAAEEDLGMQFVAWLREGLRCERLAVNEAHARVHTVAEGLLLVSPGIFKDFDRERWSSVQKRFQRLGVHRKTASGTNIFTCEVHGARRRSRVRVYVVPEPARLLPGLVLPPPNPHLSLQA